MKKTKKNVLCEKCIKSRSKYAQCSVCGDDSIFSLPSKRSLQLREVGLYCASVVLKILLKY